MKKIKRLIIISTICILSCILNVANAMSIDVEISRGERITLDVEPADSCENIKQKIQDSGKIIDRKILKYNGVELLPGTTIADNNITEDSTVYLSDIAIYGNSVFRKSATEASINIISDADGDIFYIVNENSLTPTETAALVENGGAVVKNVTKTIDIPNSLLLSGPKYVHVVLKYGEYYSNILTIQMPKDVYYFDDFEAYNINAYPEFFAIKHNGGNASLQKIIYLNGSKVFNGYGTYGTGLDERIEINSLSTGYAVLEADMSRTLMSTPTQWYFGGITIGADYDSDTRNINTLVNKNADHKFSAAFDVERVSHISSISFEANTKYHMKLVVDVANDKYDYYIDGVKANSEQLNAIPYNELNWFGLYSGDGTIHYDNIKFYSQTTNPNMHLITKGTETNGTFIIDKISAEYNETVTITPIPATGYRIKSVKINGSESGITNNITNYTFTMPNEDVTVLVEFEKIPFTIIINSVVGATITPNETINVLYGDNQDITIIANIGYRLTSVKVNGVEKISTLTEGILSLIDIQEDKNITVEVQRITKTITIRDMINGIVISDKAIASPGETVTLTITPNTGYRLNKISILDMFDDMPVSLESNYTFVMPSYNVFIYAEFGKIATDGGASTPSYRIIVEQSENGDVDPKTIRVTKNKDKKFTITPDKGYEIEDVIVDGESVGAVDTYTFERITRKHSIKAIFKKIEETQFKSYKDVLEKDWYYDSVMYVTKKEIMEGVGNDLFNPTEKTTRAMLLTVLYNLENKPTVLNDNSFKDVNSKMWYADSIAWAKENNIVNGFEDGTFGPEKETTREQMAMIINNYINYKNIKKPVELSELSFEDSNKISSWAKDSVKLIKKMKIMQGKDNNIFDSLGVVTRAEFATMIMNFCENVKLNI